MISLRTRLWFLIVFAAITPAATAQQTTPDSSALALEVRFYPQHAPAYQPVSPKRGGTWYAWFGQVRDWQPPPDTLAVTAVNVKSELAEDGVRIWVSVFLGKMHEQEKALMSYILHEGEKVTVSELTQVGVEPFEIKLVRLSLLVGETPGFVSKASSIELVVIQPNFSTLPSYKVVIRNLSGKNVSALQLQTMQGGRRRITSMPQGKEGAPLIAPGASLELDAKLATTTTQTANGNAPVILPNQVIEISSAMFDDGSFEGDSEAAIAFAAFGKGRKLMLGKVLEVLQRSLSANESATGPNLDWLKSEVAALKPEADVASAEEIHNRFAGFAGSDPNSLKTTIQIGMKGARDQVLNEITQFQLHNRRENSKPIRAWLADLKERFEVWFARL
jgi:hypothetical protein